MKIKLSSIKVVLALLAGLCATDLISAKEAAPKPTVTETKKPLVQIAILLDTSNSMDGLIEQAKGQLWKICNEFIKAKQGGVTPEVQVALYQSGNNGLDGKT